MKPILIGILSGIVAGGLTVSGAEPVPLRNATATFSQSQHGDFSVGRSIDGLSGAGAPGWAVYSGPPGEVGPPYVGTSDAQIAVFETATPVGFPGGSHLTFHLDQHWTQPGQHTLGRFRLSLTTDDPGNFADGLASGGDVLADWLVAVPDGLSSVAGTSLEVLPDGSVRAFGLSPDTDTYSVRVMTMATGITGFRLEVMEDPSLPTGGPGRQPLNGNFVLSEFRVEIAPVPEPAVGGLAVAGAVCGLAVVVRRRARE